MSSVPRSRAVRPFLSGTRPDCYHPATMIESARTSLERAVKRAAGFGLVVGPPGTGKSLLLTILSRNLREEFDVALLTGARICTRRALWQSILAELGEPYRGIDESDLRISLVERIRGLSATGSGLVVLVDEAHTLPTRLIEELRLLSNTSTPIPAVHIVLAGTVELEELLSSQRMASLSQRIAVRTYLEPLTYEETCNYCRTLTDLSGIRWDVQFELGCDEAVYSVSDGVPRTINQVCDLAMFMAADSKNEIVRLSDIHAAWREIQQMPLIDSSESASALSHDDPSNSMLPSTIEFATLDDFPTEHGDSQNGSCSLDFDTLYESPSNDHSTDSHSMDIEDVVNDRFAPSSCWDETSDSNLEVRFDGPHQPVPMLDNTEASDPWAGPDVELVFDLKNDPFEEYFADEENVVDRYLVTGPDDFQKRRHVASREGSTIGKGLDDFVRNRDCSSSSKTPATESLDMTIHKPSESVRYPSETIEALRPFNMNPSPHSSHEPSASSTIEDDTDMILIEEDLVDSPASRGASVFAVSLGDYRRLFSRLRRGTEDRT